MSPQSNTVDPVRLDRLSCLYTIPEYSVLARLSAPTDRMDCTYVCSWRNSLVFHFVGSSMYIQLLHLR